MDLKSEMVKEIIDDIELRYLKGGELNSNDAKFLLEISRMFIKVVKKSE